MNTIIVDRSKLEMAFEMAKSGSQISTERMIELVVTEQEKEAETVDLAPKKANSAKYYTQEERNRLKHVFEAYGCYSDNIPTERIQKIANRMGRSYDAIKTQFYLLNENHKKGNE